MDLSKVIVIIIFVSLLSISTVKFNGNCHSDQVCFYDNMYVLRNVIGRALIIGSVTDSFPFSQ